MASPAKGRSEFDDVQGRVSFTWTFAGAPIRVKIPLDLIGGMQAEIAEPSDVEIGGVLIGRPIPELAMVEIHDYIRVPCAVGRDHEYTLDLRELDSLRKTKPVIGYYRTELQGALKLRGDEIDFVRTQFPDPTNVVLLIQPSNVQDRAGFFFWDNGTFFDTSIKSFPFDAALLRAWGVSSSMRPPITADTEFAMAYEAEKPKTRWEQPAEPRSEPAPADTPVPRLIALLRRTLPAIRASWPARFLPLPLRIPRISGRILVATGLAMLALIVLAAALIWRLRGAPPKHRGAEQTVILPLQLNVESQAPGLSIRWNPQSTSVSHVREGRLVFGQDGRQPNVERLTRAQLDSGHVYHHGPSSGRVNVRLEVVDSAGKLASESVVVLTPRTAATSSKTRPPETLAANSSRSPEGAKTPQRSPQQAASSPRSDRHDAAKLHPRPPATYRPPVPTKREPPVLERSTAALIPLNGQIKIAIRVQIDESGRVVEANALPGKKSVDTQLTKAALDAAMLWRFEPAHRGSQAVPSDHIVNFVLQSR